MACQQGVHSMQLRGAVSGTKLTHTCKARCVARPATLHVDAIQRLLGKVVSSKASKTIIVAFQSYSEHPIYHKRVQKTSRISAHDEEGRASIGDYVAIIPCRPVSKTKRFKLEKIVKKYQYEVDETTGIVSGTGNFEENDAASASQEELGIPTEQLA